VYESAGERSYDHDSGHYIHRVGLCLCDIPNCNTVAAANRHENKDRLVGLDVLGLHHRRMLHRSHSSQRPVHGRGLFLRWHCELGLADVRGASRNHRRLHSHSATTVLEHYGQARSSRNVLCGFQHPFPSTLQTAVAMGRVRAHAEPVFRDAGQGVWERG